MHIQIQQSDWKLGSSIINKFEKLYIINGRECLTMVSKHEKAYEARGATSSTSLWLRLDVDLFLMFSNHDETLELVFDILRQTLPHVLIYNFSY